MDELSDDKPMSDRTPFHNTVETSKPKSSGELPDFAFVDFAKRYMALLATVSAIPIISMVFGVVTPPDGNSKLPVLTSLTCLVIFAACFQVREVFAYFMFHKRRLLHTVPFFLVIVLLLFSIALTSGYYIKQEHWAELRKNQEQAKMVQLATGKLPSPEHMHPGRDTRSLFVRLFYPTNADPNWLDVMQYILIHPLFILALGIILVTSFTQNQTVSIVTLLESQFSDGDRQRLLKRVRSAVDFDRYASDLEKRGCSALREVGNQLTEECDAKLHALSHGCIEAPAREARYVMGLLFKSFHSSKGEMLRFDEVSDRDLDFWIGTDDPHTSTEYFRLNVQAVNEGIRISRLFILTDEDLFDDKRRNQLARVLMRHQDANIAWAVVLYNEMDPRIRQANVPNDFGLFNVNEVVSLFREYRQGSRKSQYVFRTDDNRAFIDRQRDQYRQILSHCWMYDSAFKGVYPKFNALEMICKPASSSPSEASKPSNHRMQQILAHSRQFAGKAESEFDLPIIVDTSDKIAAKLNQLKELRKVSHDWYSENSAFHDGSPLAVVFEVDAGESRSEVMGQIEPFIDPASG